MRIAIPIEDGKLCGHFGGAPEFAFVDVDPANKSISGIMNLSAPPHEPGVFPKWLAENKTELLIAGGMGARAQELLGKFNINIITGVEFNEGAEELARRYLKGELVSRPVTCNHNHHGAEDGCGKG